MAKNTKNQINMTAGPMLPKIITFLFPILLTGMLQLCYNSADMIVVGQFAGPQALSAVGSTGALTNLIITCFMGLSVGAGVGISKSFGAKKYDVIENTVHTALFVSIVSGVFLTIVGYFISKPLLAIMDTPHDVIDGATIYMRIFFIGMPFNLLYNFGASMLRAIGDTKRPLKFLAISGIVNVVLNLFFVIVLQLSVVGVALATITAQAVSAFLVVKCFLQKDSVLHLDFNKLKIHKKELIDIIRIGLPAGLQGAMFSISNVTVQSAINSFGSIATAGNVASSNLEGFLYIGMNSVSNAAITAAAQNMGAEQYKRVRTGFYYSLCVVTVIGAILGVTFYTFAEPLIALYTNEPQAIVIGVQRIRIMSSFYVIFGIMDVVLGQLRGMGSSILPTAIAFCFVCMFRVLWVAFVFPQYNTLDAIYWAYPISWTLSNIGQFTLYKLVSNRLPKDNIPLAQS